MSVLCFWFVRRGVVRSGVVVGASGAGSSGRVASVVPVSCSFLRVACVRGGCSGRVLVVVPGVVRSGGSGRGGGSVRWRVRVMTSASSSWGPCVGLLRRAVPLFFGASLTADPRGTLPAGGKSSIRCGGTNREEYLSAKGDWQSAAMPTIKA